MSEVRACFSMCMLCSVLLLTLGTARVHLGTLINLCVNLSTLKELKLYTFFLGITSGLGIKYNIYVCEYVYDCVYVYTCIVGIPSRKCLTLTIGYINSKGIW